MTDPTLSPSGNLSSSEFSELPENKDAVLRKIAKSSVYGNLGFFVGAGFSKAFVDSPFGETIPLSWEQLLEKVCETLKVDKADVFRKGASFPEVASNICQEHAQALPTTYTAAKTILKTEVSKISSWLPRKEIRDAIGALLLQINPSWIITTNYDFVIESMLADRGKFLGPDDVFVAAKGEIPIFHLHGHRHDPQSIVLTQEDYTELFRPHQYRQSKLPLLIMESTVVSVGYGIGDPNVLMAMDWSRNVYKGQRTHTPTMFVQVSRAPNPTTTPYHDRNGVIVVEFEELRHFFEELAPLIVNEQALAVEQQQKREKLSAILIDGKSDLIRNVIDDPAFRAKFIQNFGVKETVPPSATIQFLRKCIDETWTRSAPNGAFEGYNEQLKITLDFLTAIPVKKMHPVMFEFLAEALDGIANYVGPRKGQSFNAHSTWEKEKHHIPKDMVTDLRAFAEQHSKRTLLGLLKEL